ncbi:MAG: dihydropteroate synthase [Candidatus Heimdallarchaeaceae archaeon]
MIEGFLGELVVGDNHPVRIVGILNLSPTSFYSGSIVSSEEELTKVAARMIEEGADGLDLGAQSTRPIQIYGGEGRVDSETELNMIKKALKPVLDVVSCYENIEVSVDTTRSVVANYALKKDVKIINDISGFKKDKQMAKLIADFNAYCVIMAAKKEPGDVFILPEIIEELRKSISIGENAGIKKDRVSIDPGIGSWEARDYHHDYNIIKNLRDFRELGKPIYLGISRKTSIGKVLDNAPPEERLFGTIGATIVAIVNGAHIIRTHDVKPTREAIRVAETILAYKD